MFIFIIFCSGHHLFPLARGSGQLWVYLLIPCSICTCRGKKILLNNEANTPSKRHYKYHLPWRDSLSWTHLLNIKFFCHFVFIILLHMTEKLPLFMTVYLNSPVHGVSSMLNSATGTPLIASIGAKPAAGYTTDDVPTRVCTIMQVQYTQ